ncbi:MAG TPA: neutral/alkaline non-lysosomal ceramidase N-terminal domain-containing protein, partial [Polyangiaceae bacterium]
AIGSAVASLAPAKVASETVHVPFVTFNRSPEAARRNVCPGCGGTKVPDVDDRLHMLRVDRVVGSGTEPIGAFAVFAVHGTAVAESNQLYHGDVPGYAARRLTALVKSAHPGAVGFVGAVANGAEGDVSPTKVKQGFAEAELVGRAIGKAAYDAYEAAGAHLSADVDLGHAYRELVVPGAHTVAGDVCDSPMVGIPTIAGAEDGPSFLRGKFGVYEGRRKDEPEGCQGTKEPALGSLTEHFVLGDRMPGIETMPRIGAFNVTALYHDDHRRSVGSDPEPIVVYATVPGEPTTAVGHAIAERVALELVPIEEPKGKSRADDPSDKVAVIGLTNAYLGYFTSSAEYAAQAYEGGSTFYGPLQSLLAAEQLQSLAARVRERLPVPSAAGVVSMPPLRERSADSLFYAHNDYKPGPSVHFFGARSDCAAGEHEWAALGISRTSKAGKLDHVTFQWTGLHKDFFCPPPKIVVVCGGAPLVDRFGQAETDDGTRFEVSRKGVAEWSLAFFPTETEVGQPRCTFQIRRTREPPVTSPEFSL